MDKRKEAAAKNWRLSLNPASLFEKIFSHLNSGGCKAKKVLKLIKDIKAVALEEKDRGILKSYNVRQTLLWCAHERGYCNYTEEQLLLAILRRMSMFLREGFLPSFLEEKRNLIFNLSQDQCKFGNHQLEEIIVRIGHWINCVHDCQLIQQRNLADLAAKLTAIPGVMQFSHPGFLAKAAADNIAKHFRTTDKNNEEQVFFDLRSLPKNNYDPQFKNNIEGLEYHLEKAIQALKALLMEQIKPGMSEGQEQSSKRLHQPAITENCQNRVDCPFTTIPNDTTREESNLYEKEEVYVVFAAEKRAFLDLLSNLSVDPGDASLSCSLPNKEIISRSRWKVTAENIQVQGVVLKPAPLTLIGDGSFSSLALQANLSIELSVSLNLKVEILVKLFGSEVHLTPESYPASLKGFGRVKLSVDLQAQNLQVDHAGKMIGIVNGKPKMSTMISFNNYEVDSLDLGSLQLPELLNYTDTTATIYSSIIKDYLKKELEEQRCKWNTKQLEEKVQEILDGKIGLI